MADTSKRGRGLLTNFLLIMAAFAVGFMVHKYGAGPDNENSPDAGTEAAAEQEVTWTCSMDPQVRSPKFGLCPICGMDLIPLTNDMGNMDPDSTEIELSPRARKLAEVQTAPVERKPLWAEISLFGKVAVDETRLAHVTSWIPGRIDQLYVAYTGAVIHKGDPLAWFYSPDLLVAQEELIQSKKALAQYGQDGAGDSPASAMAGRTLEATREKLMLWGLTEDQVAAIEGMGTPSDHMTILAPMAGTVIVKTAEEGTYVRTGDCIFTIADLSRVWLLLDAYEYDIQWIGTGQEAAFQVEAYPGETFLGTVEFIDPVLDEATRTVKVRLEADNDAGKLKPGMFVRAMIYAPIDGEEGSGEEHPLAIPASAPLITGRRAVVYVAHPAMEGKYEGREIVLGPKAGEYYVVRSGLVEGEQVVTRGNFKIDSALQLQARPSMMNDRNEGAGDE